MHGQSSEVLHRLTALKPDETAPPACARHIHTPPPIDYWAQWLATEESPR